MNTTLQTRLDALTTHLTALVDSITSYNPSPASAAALLHEDALLTTSLETLATHQSNFATLERLRATTAQLDTQIKDSLRTLADTRKELISQRPRDTRAEGVEAVDVNDLLQTAQRIAKYTTPPTLKQKSVPKPSTSPPGSAQASPKQANTSINTNNTQTTELATQSFDPHGTQPADSAQRDGDREIGEGEAQTPTTRTRDRIPEHLLPWIEPPQGADGSAIWTPWPNENVIRAGALGRVQRMVEDGVDPATLGAGVGTDGGAGEGVEKGGEQRVVNEGAAAEGRMGNVVLDERGREELERRREEARRKAEDEKKRQAEMMEEFDLYDPDE